MNAQPPAPEAPRAEPPLTVLVADDIKASLNALAQLVESLGHRTVRAGSGAEALQCVATQRPDIILLDLLMPDLDGFEVTRLVREQVSDRWLPVIVTSSLRGEQHFIHALSRGADDYLPRPVNPPLLEAKLRHYQRVLGLQARLAGLAQRQQAIHESIADAVITVDADGRISEANRTARQLLATTEPVGETLHSVIGLDLADLPGTRQIELTDRHGQRLPLSVSVGNWSIGPQTYTTIALHDLSEQRRVERMKDEFLATVSHELRTPLTSVIGALGLLTAGVAGPLPAGAQELAAVARRNGDRLSRLIDDVLDLTKLEGNRMALQTRASALDTLMAEAIAANDGYAQRGGVILQWSGTAASPRAFVDPDRFLQIMANLLSNAIKHSRAGQTVRVALYGVPQGWRIDVIDEGPGIDPAFRARLFDKFAQADSSDRRAVGGTGLGLYISRLLVERMGGRIFAESTPGQGSTFSLVLPAHQTGAHWLLCLARDRQRLDRLAQWLAPLSRVETAADAAQARALVARHGPPAALVADPQGQERADHFCAELCSLAPRQAIVLTGDSIDAGFAAAQRLAWVPGMDGGPQPLVERVREQLANTSRR